MAILNDLLVTGSARFLGDAYMYSTEAPEGDIDALAKFTSGKPGICGSLHLVKKSSGTGSQIPAGWYNYIHIPHRTGISNAQTSGIGSDNPNYSTIILTPLNFAGASWILRRSNSTTAITEVKKIVTSDMYSFNSSTKTLTITM